jgi:outer membrane protein OmpA-like peptidoglycan-associated protein
MKYLLITGSIFLFLSCGTTKLSMENEAIHRDNIERKELLLKLLDKKNELGELTEQQVKRMKDSINESFNRNKIEVSKNNSFVVRGNVSQNKIRMYIITTKEDLDFSENQVLKDSRGEYGMKKAFSPGDYEIPFDSYEKVAIGYKDLFDRIVLEVKKYPNRTLKADIVIIGYSDAQEFSKNSPTYNRLKEKLGVKNPTNNDLNLKLSELRAESIKNVFENYFNKIEDEDIKKRLVVDIKYFGKGEEFPNPKIKYAENDEKRRIVVIKWILI